MISTMLKDMVLSLFLAVIFTDVALCQNRAPQFLQGGNLQRFRILENTRVGDVVYTLKATDPEGSKVLYGIQADFLQVNSDTGEVRVSRKIDYELSPSFNVIIIASDGTSDTKLNVPIQVIDSNDEQPLFQRDTYKTTIDENAPIGTTVMRDLTISDKDTINRLIQVRCAEEKITDVTALNTCDKFGLVTLQASNLNWTGVLVLRESLDYESKSSYQVPLQSFDGNPENNVTQSVEIIVNPIQDTGPIWVSAPNKAIQENIPVGSSVTRVSAEDGDTGNPRPVRYEIYNNPGNYFTINDQSGQISTAKEIDRENGDFNQGFVILSLRARELINSTHLGNDRLTTAVTTVRITIEDINDNPPTFDKSSYTVSIPEDIPTGSALPGLFMTVTDSDSGAVTSYTFQLLNNTREFEVFPGVGQGTTTVSMKVRDTNLINYETGPREYVMKIIARERGTQELFSSETTVTVRITDVNDNSPVFDRDSYTANVMENAVENTFVIKVGATDQDSTPGLGTESIVYSLSGTDSNRFKINPLTGEIVVNYCATPGERPCIDFEQLAFYELVVTANDMNGRGQDVPTQLRINVLNVNDVAPRFLISNYGSTIIEKQRLPDPEVYVQANDRDINSVLRYSVISQDGTDPNLFQIDPISGYVTATRNVRFNDTQPNTDEIKITVQASDGIFTTTALVTIQVIDVNDGPPRFIQDPYVAAIPETTRGVNPVTSVSAIDVDSLGKVSYEIISGDQDRFGISASTGDITTLQNATFNYDTQPQYVMLVIARDEGSPQMTGTATVTVNIIDKNNRDPYFQPANLRASVYENVAIGFIVRTISGQDPDNNANLHYSFGSGKRAYSPTGGEVNVADYDFTNLFTIGEINGVVRTNANLSRDETSLITYPIVVVDKNATGQTGTGTLIIDILDVNDKAPIFKPGWTVANPIYRQDLDEEKTQGTFVRVMVATDPDGAIDRYEMVWNPGQYFLVNPNTGEVTVNRRLDYDYDKGNPQPKTYNFTVRAHDNGLSPLYSDATVIINLININDNTPRFNPATYTTSLFENSTAGGSQPGQTLVTVTATDLDAGLYGDVYYQLDPSETRFSIGRTSGIITLLENNFDRETTSEITFPVFAFDSDTTDQRSASVQVYVRIDDINDNPPIFTKPVYEKKIPEITGGGQVIIQLSATDRDLIDQDNLRFMYLNSTGTELFGIQKQRGFVQPTRSLQGLAGVYEYPVIVKDNGGADPYKFDTAILRITVQAVVNHPPRWVKPPRDNFTILILEEQYDGMIVYDVDAVDDDTGSNSIVSYSFETRESDNVTVTPEFRINPITGVIRAQRVFDREERSRYTLVLVARDRGGLKNTIFLIVAIKDVNDHLPRFSPQEYTVPIPENHAVGTPVLKDLTATDADKEILAKRVFYKIIAGNEDEMFTIDMRTGVISLAKPLDAETKSSYTLEVMGYNNVSDYSVISKRSLPQNIATVYIIVNDINDNAPEFQHSSYFSCVPTSTALGQSVLQVTATDKDSMSVLRYNLRSADVNLPQFFSLNPDTGVLTNTMLMGNLAGKNYNFKVVVTDGRANHTADTTLFVTNPDNEAMIVLAQPPEEVEGIRAALETQLSTLLTQRNADKEIRVCITRVENHISADASVNTAWSDVYFNGMYKETGTIYGALTAAELVSRTKPLVTNIADREDLNVYYVREVMLKPSTAQAQFLSTPALVVMILVIILIILAILLCLCCCCCYNPRKHKKDKQKLIGGATSGYTIEQHQSADMGVDVAPIVYDTGFNRAQAYENKAYVAEQVAVQQTAPQDPVYATVQKKSHNQQVASSGTETHERIETTLHQEARPAQTMESFSETRIVTEPESTRENIIITELLEEGEKDNEIHTTQLVRQNALETQGIEVEFHDSPIPSPTMEHPSNFQQPGTRVEYHEETVKTVM